MPAPAPPPRRPDARRRRRTTRGRRSGATRRRASRVRGGAAEPPRVACGACPPPPCHSCPSLGVRGERRARDGGVARELKEHIVRERREQRDVRRVGGARELDVPALHHDAFAHVDEDLLLVRAALRDDGGDGVDLLEIAAGLALHRELQRGHTAAERVRPHSGLPAFPSQATDRRRSHSREEL